MRRQFGFRKTREPMRGTRRMADAIGSDAGAPNITTPLSYGPTLRIGRRPAGPRPPSLTPFLRLPKNRLPILQGSSPISRIVYQPRVVPRQCSHAGARPHRRPRCCGDPSRPRFPRRPSPQKNLLLIIGPIKGSGEFGLDPELLAEGPLL